MTTSFKAPQPSPLGLVLSLARSLGLVSTVDDVVIVPLSQWQAMHERHTADSEALRSALARVVEVEARANQNERDRRDAVARWQVAEAAERRLTAELANCQIRGGVIEAIEKALTGERITYASKRLTTATDAVAELATARGQP